MKILKIIGNSFAQAMNSWALREIDPLHPDLPMLVIERQKLQDEARKMFA